MPSRRMFLKYAAAGFGTAIIGPGHYTFAATTEKLLDRVTAACRRLAPLGWRDMLLDATGGALDITALDLAAELARTLTQIDRAHSGFGDFALSGSQAITPGSPDRSLLYHAFAAPTVVTDRHGVELRGFPTLAEIEAVENYVYGVVPPRIDEIRQRAAGHKLGVVVFALHYRNAPSSVHQRHAQLCFARAGIARLGTDAPLYDDRLRNFTSAVADNPFAFRVVPRRYAAYLAVQANGAWSGFGPQDALPDDDKRQFWVPLHKLFSGSECIKGMDLELSFGSGLRNDEIAMFHKFLDIQGLKNNVSGEALEHYPFVIKDEKIGDISKRADFGAGVMEPKPGPMISVAEYEGQKLTFPVDGSYSSQRQNLQLSSLQVLPGLAPDKPRYMNDAAQNTQRPGPEYINIRHRVLPDGSIENLNDKPDLKSVLRQGGYDTLHYIDGAGDGWVEAHCPQLDGKVDVRVPAYSMVGLPDFFPQVSQRDLMQWWRHEVPEKVRAALWMVPPLALSQTRIAANITLPIGFSVTDDTVPAIVSHFTDALGPEQRPNGKVPGGKVGMPDGSPGLFDPGWDSSQGIYFSDKDQPLQKFLAGYGLGSPFIEDAKLCAALGAYWPGVAPDSTRTFAPDKQVGGIVYPYPTIVPLTDEEIGISPVKGGRYAGKMMPWDGVAGPRAIREGGFRYAVYTDAEHVDYIDMLGTMTAALTARIDTAEYKARTLAMEAVYWGLGIHDPDILADKDQPAPELVMAAKSKWAVLSFQKTPAGDADASAAQRQAGVDLKASALFRFHVFRWGKEIADQPQKGADGKPVFTVRVEMLEEAVAYVSGTVVLMQRNGGTWALDTSMPT